MLRTKDALHESLLARMITNRAALVARLDADDAAFLDQISDEDVPSDEELWGLAPDPLTDPPDGGDAWVTDLPAELLEEYFAATAPPPDPDLVKAGFLHRTADDGFGFASGGTSDALPPGPVLAGLAGRAWDDGLDRLSDDALIGVLCAARRLASWAAALEFSAAANLMRRRFADEEAGQTGVAEHADDELAAALTLTGRAADRLLDLSLTLDRLPATMAALRAGEIDAQRAAVIADETSSLGPAHRAAVEDHILRRASGQTTSELRAAARRAVIAADPTAARKRKEKAQRDARVERWQEDAGTAALAGRDLPPAGVLAADQYLSGIARALKSAGVHGTMDNLRALVYLTLLAGQPVSSLFPAGPHVVADPDTPPNPSAAANTPANPSAAANSNAVTDVGAPRHPSAAADSSAPANPSATADANAPANPSATADPGAPGSPHSMWPPWLASWIGGDGSPAVSSGTAPGARTPGAPMSPANRGALPWPTAGSVNLTMPLATWLGMGDAPGSVAGVGPLDADDSRSIGSALATRADTKWCITLTDPEGRAVAHGCASPPPRAVGRRRRGRSADESRAGPEASPRPESHGGGPGRDDVAWNFAITPFPGQPCDHHLQTAAYRVSPQLRHVLEVRNATCFYVGCRRPAEHCDMDHTVPYDRGGPTCSCNVAPGCRRHHKAKQTPGWRLVQRRPGELTWATPSGRTYTVRPTEYLE